MKYLKFLIYGGIFGIILVKSEVVSWFRIQEMFRFQSFHMYGVIGAAVAVGVISVLLIKKFNLRSMDGSEVDLTPKPYQWKSHIIGGTIFGLGWALTGACPGPLYSLIGSGYLVVIVPLACAVLGALVYGLLKSKLPH